MTKTILVKKKKKYKQMASIATDDRLVVHSSLICMIISLSENAWIDPTN